jgi:hypothetical protein
MLLLDASLDLVGPPLADKLLWALLLRVSPVTPSVSKFSASEALT